MRMPTMRWIWTRSGVPLWPFMLLLTAPAGAQEWRAAADNTQAPLTVMFVDVAGLVREKDIATGDVLTVMADDERSARDWNYSIFRRKIDCARGQSQIVSSRFYKNDIVLGEDRRASDWFPIREGSVFQGVAEAMCGRQEYLTPPVENPVALARVYFAERESDAKQGSATQESKK